MGVTIDLGLIAATEDVATDIGTFDDFLLIVGGVCCSFTRGIGIGKGTNIFKEILVSTEKSRTFAL